MTKLLSGPSPPIPSPVPHLLIAQCVQKEQLRTTIVLKMTLLIVLAGWGQYFHVLVTHHDFSVFLQNLLDTSEGNFPVFTFQHTNKAHCGRKDLALVVYLDNSKVVRSMDCRATFSRFETLACHFSSLGPGVRHLTLRCSVSSV